MRERACMSPGKHHAGKFQSGLWPYSPLFQVMGMTVWRRVKLRGVTTMWVQCGGYFATWRKEHGRRKNGLKPEDMAGWESPIVPLQE
jgi:hypothetical protein